MVASDGTVWYSGLHTAYYGGEQKQSNEGSFIGYLSLGGTPTEITLEPGTFAGQPVVVYSGEVWYPESRKDAQGNTTFEVVGYSMPEPTPIERGGRKRRFSNQARSSSRAAAASSVVDYGISKRAGYCEDGVGPHAFGDLLGGRRRLRSEVGDGGPTTGCPQRGQEVAGAPSGRSVATGPAPTAPPAAVARAAARRARGPAVAEAPPA